ncbi:MAG: hypothetical protein ACR2FY_15975 [Pirellulaceae bacterium]
MTRTGMIILGVCGMFFGWTLIALLLLLYGNDWWLSGLTTLTVFAWLVGLLVVMFQQGRVRAAATGAVIAAAAYWLLALGPWFSTNVGPTLLTSRGLAHLDVLLHGPPQQIQTLAWSVPQATYATSPVIVSGSGVLTTNTMPASVTSQALAFVNTPVVSPGGSVFQVLGQWLIIWLCAALGSLAALLMHMRTQRMQPPLPGAAA